MFPLKMKNLLLIFFFLLTYANLNCQTLVIAHRGASAYKTENSISAFAEAIRSGADYIETDVHQTLDGIVVLMHDFSVDRTCDVPARIKNKKKTLVKNITFNDFNALRFKSISETPPSLDSAIKFINGRCKLLIELKKGNDYYPDIEKHIIEIIKANNAESWVDIIHSFDKKALLNVQEQKSGIKLQKLIVFKLPLSSFVFSKQLNKDDFKNWQGVNVYRLFASKRLINKLHKQNIQVFVWTVNKKRKTKKLIKRGVDGIITNKPDMVKKLLCR